MAPAASTANLEIAEHLLGLRLEIALADQLAGCIARYLSRQVDQRALVDLGDVRIADTAAATSPG